MRFEAIERKPDWLEEELSKLESKAVSAIREVTMSRVFSGESKIYVLNLMALLAVRSPEQRENMREFQERLAKRLLDMMLHDKEWWESQHKEMEGATGKASSVTYEEAKEFHTRGEYTIEVSRERHIHTELDLYDTVLQLLGQRKWSLYLIPGDYGEFVTTSRPVVLAYVDPEKVPLYLRNSPGFALKNTEVFFPLTKHALLIGRWDGDEKTINLANQAFVGAINNQMIQHSYGLVLSSAREVLYHDPLLRLQWDDKLIRRFRVPPTADEIAQFKAKYDIGISASGHSD